MRALLALGDLVESAGRHVRIDGLQLLDPPATPPPLLAGVMREKSLQLSGRVADGTILAEGIGSTASDGQCAAAHFGDEAGGTPAPTGGPDARLHRPDAERVRAATAEVRREFAAVDGVDEGAVFLANGRSIGWPPRRSRRCGRPAPTASCSGRSGTIRWPWCGWP